MQPLSDNFTNVPAFLTKLWKMVSDAKTDHLICWSPNGNSFIILNQVQFWYELLPLYYKHNNMSSFVRQLNMYGFHKVSSIENGPAADAEKDEVQFFHPYFQKGSPDLLKLIKRKVTAHKNSDNGGQVMKNEDLSKVLQDVKLLRGRQAYVDSQLATMKNENAVLWKELAVMRQKHSKQQQIVNKLIQFLVSMVHPGGNRMGVSVKRRYPLMLRATPSKRPQKNPPSKNDGPTIHELDNDIESDLEPEELLVTSDAEEKDLPLMYRPLTPSSSTPSIGVSPLSNIDLANELIETDNVPVDNQSNNRETTSPNINKDTYWDKSPYGVEQIADNEDTPSSCELLTNVEIPDDPILDILEGNIIKNSKPTNNEIKVFINPSSQDTLLSNVTNQNLNGKDDNDKKEVAQSSSKKSSQVEGTIESSSSNNNMTVATRQTDAAERISDSTDDCFSGDLGSILDNNQSEIDLYKDLLHSCGTFDTSTLMGDNNRMPFYQHDYTLFNDGASEYGLSFSQDSDLSQHSGDPMVSGQEIATYPMLQLEELLDDSLNNTDLVDEIIEDDLSQLNTPQVSDIKPVFPNKDS